MRPRTLRIEGLRSYLGEQTIDFRDRDLMAIVGDTGAGKSSILEALCFALYGSASWNNKAVKELISHGRDVMRVELVFAADGHEWTLTRTAARESYPRPITLLACAALDIKLERKKEVDEKVLALVGLDYHAFLRAVILPQGRFQQLLQATAAERAKLLKGIFRLDLLEQLRDWAEKWRDERDPQWQTLCDARARLHQDPAAEAEAALTEMQRLADETRQLTSARERYAEVKARADQAGARLRDLEAALEAVQNAPIRDLRGALEQLERAHADIMAEERELKAALADLERERDALTQTLSEREQGGLGLEQLGQAVIRLEEAGKSVRQAEQAAIQAASQEQALEQCEQRLEQCANARASAETTHLEARDAVEQARRANMAAHLARQLQPGEPCPVCRQDMPEAFRKPRAANKALERAEADLKRAAAAEKQAREQESQALRGRDHAHAAFTRSRETFESARIKVTELLADIPAAVAPDDPGAGAIDDALGRVRAFRAEREQHDQALRELDRAVHTRRAALDALGARRTRSVTLPARDAAGRLDQHTDLLAALAHVLGAQPPARCAAASADSPAALVAEMRAHVDLFERAAGELVAAAEAMQPTLAHEHATLEREAGDLIARTGHARLEDLIKRIGASESEHKSQESRHREASAQIERAARLDQHIARARDLRAAVDELRKLLSDGKFVSYAVERKQRALLCVASQLISDMTGGRFGFAADFQIVDNHAREARSTDTLSGGETFLASLALALALVELANRTGGRLDALFLDEGFGALDRDALEQAVQALSAQAARGRLVVVISHLQAVAENIEHVLLVEATPMGSRAHELDPQERSRFDLETAGLVA